MTKTTETPLRTVLPHFPPALRHTLGKMSEEDVSHLQEIRMRVGGATTGTLFGKTYFVTENGLSTSADRVIRITEQDADGFLAGICGGSPYAYESQIAEGFITFCNIRVGLSGTKKQLPDGRRILTDITSFNIRLPQNIVGSASPLISKIEQGYVSPGEGILIASAPGQGKTTFLRDLARSLSKGIRADGGMKKIYRVAVIDERNEIYMKDAFEDCAVDVLSGVSKAEGLAWAVRVLSSDVIICDEIGSSADSDSLRYAHFGGVMPIASVHETSVAQIMKNDSLRKLIECGVFGKIVILSFNRGRLKVDFYDVSHHD